MPTENLQVIKSWPRMDKKCLTVVKPKSLFLALAWCLMQTEKTVAVFLSLFMSNVTL